MSFSCERDDGRSCGSRAEAAGLRPNSSSRGRDGSGEGFPAGLRVLLVDDDPVCLMVIGQMLRACQYEVSTCSAATSALDQLRDKTHNFDLVLSDVYMPDMDGFKLLEVVGLELGLPVIMMSANDEHSTVMRGVTHGACDFLIKPVRIEELKNIWQHVVWRSKHNATAVRDAESDDAPGNQDADSSRKRNMQSRDGSCNEQQQREEEGGASKKPRVVWSVEMHQQFVQAVNQLGIDKAVPKKILELMKVEGLTRENVASHLQKYRLYLKRVQQPSPQPSAGNAAVAAAAAAIPKNIAAAAAAAGVDVSSAGAFNAGGVAGCLPSMLGSNQLMWGNGKQLLDAMAAQQQAVAAQVQQAAGVVQPQQQPNPQQQQQQLADGMAASMLGMMPGGGGGGLMSPMGGAMLPGINMGMAGMPGLPGLGGLPGMGSAAAAAGMMGLPGMPGFGAAMMGLMPGMAGLPGGGLQGMPGAMNALGQMPAAAMRPGMPGAPGDSAAVMAMMSAANMSAAKMSAANMQAMFQAQQQAAAAAVTLPTNSGGGSTGALAGNQQQPQSLPLQATATAGMPAATAAAGGGLMGLAPALLKQEPGAGGMGLQSPAGAMPAQLAAATAMGAANGLHPHAAAGPHAGMGGTPDFSRVFDDMFDGQQQVAQAAGPTAALPLASGPPALVAGAGGPDEEFLIDFILKGA